MDFAVTPIRRHSSSIASELGRRNVALTRAAVLLGALFITFTVTIALDPRTVGGESVWLKPAKFAGSLALFVGSLAWLSPHLPVGRPTLRYVSWAIAAGVVLELALIVGQAARGVESHFNTGTALDAAIYSAMGATIVGVLLLVLALTVLTWSRSLDVHPAFAWGIRLGLATFVIGSFEGGAMVAAGASAVGNGPAVPILGWALGGDFRVAHFVGLHALQVLPLAGWIAARRAWPNARGVEFVALVALFHLSVLVLTLSHAFAAIGG